MVAHFFTFPEKLLLAVVSEDARTLVRSVPGWYMDQMQPFLRISVL